MFRLNLKIIKAVNIRRMISSMTDDFNYTIYTKQRGQLLLISSCIVLIKLLYSICISIRIAKETIEPIIRSVSCGALDADATEGLVPTLIN